MKIILSGVFIPTDLAGSLETLEYLHPVSGSVPAGDKALFLGAFAKLRKAIICFVMSVCLSVRIKRTRFPLDGFS
jgi:hypothetical protein